MKQMEQVDPFKKNMQTVDAYFSKEIKINTGIHVHSNAV